MRHLADEMIFESFEASPTAAAVIEAEGKLVCSYPGPAVAVSLDKAKSHTFCDEFASFLEQMNKEVLDDAMPTSKKAGSNVAEERDTPHPMFITEMLTSILRAIGRPADINRFQKRIADDVLWHNTKLPWRRSPLWLVVRVALQATLKHSVDYKNFMIFLVAEILELAVKSQLPSDILFVMNAKLSRRASKMRNQMSQVVLRKAHATSEMVSQKVKRRWTEIQEYNSVPLSWTPEQLPQVVLQDRHFSLLNSRKYLTDVMARKGSGSKKLEFNPSHSPPTPPRNDSTGDSTNLPPRNLSNNTSNTRRYILLADFEAWVQQNLYDWVTRNLHRETACQELSDWIEDYTSAGKTAYESNPENTSIMLLTTLELWAAMDIIVVFHYPLLSDYALDFPGPDKLFEPLLLPRYGQMERLHEVEVYFQRRQAAARYPSIFSDTVDSNTFAVRYFTTSSQHQKLQQDIEEEAEEKRRIKIQEFEKMEKAYDHLVAQASVQQCTYTYRKGKPRHKAKTCGKCKIEKQAKGMKIEIHEWPLPKDYLQLMVVVFELQCPLGFSVWRDTTYKILIDLLTPTQPTEGSHTDLPSLHLCDYSGLQAHFRSPGSQRLAWSSSTKSFLGSHYRHHTFPTSVNTILMDNALNYSLFDTAKSKWTQQRLGYCDVRSICTFSLPHGPHKLSRLQYAVDGTSHTSNEVISNRSNCSTELSLHEYDSFGTLRAGHRLQWLNIARELRTNTLTLNNEAVYVLIMQAAWQAGPSDASSNYRESHVDLERLEFGQTLLEELDQMLTSIEANWLEGISAKLMISLTTRLLSTNKHTSITEGTIALLRRARAVTLRWTRELVERLQQSEDEANMKDLQLRVLQMAAICRGTYDVDNCHLEAVCSSAEDVAILIECATIVHDNSPVETDSLPLSARHLLSKDRRLSHALENHLRGLIIQRSEYLDKSIERVYPSYIPGSQWDCSPHSWMATKTAGDRPQQVHYNLLTGELLINASPVGRMPLEFITHATYRRILGEVRTHIIMLERVELTSFLTTENSRCFSIDARDGLPDST